MAKQTRRLGRGLESLVTPMYSEGDSRMGNVPTPQVEARADERSERSDSREGIEARMVPVGDILTNPYQPRRDPGGVGISSLAESIRRNGILQPITVRRAAGGGYEIVAGERRLIASKAIALSDVPVIVRKATDEQMLELALVENLQREDLNAIDRARAYRRYCTEFSLSPEAVAERIGEDRTTVVNYLRLLDLPDGIRSLVADRRISMGHARALLGVADSELQWRLAQDVQAQGLSVRALEALVRQGKDRGNAAPASDGDPQHAQSPHIRDVERRFEEVLKTKVTIREGKRKGRGRIIIDYYSLDDFDRISSILGVPEE